MMKKLFFTVVIFSISLCAKAQDIETILHSVESNNKELQALQKDKEATALEIKNQNNLEDPSVDYSPFYTKGINGVASSELTVSQGFDFPTLYIARHKLGKLQRQVVDLQYLTSRRDILLNAKNICLDLIRFNKEKALLEKRRENTEELLVLFEKRLEKGDATILEVNKIRMDRMNIQTEVAQNEASIHTAMQSLLAINGNIPITFDVMEYAQIGSIEDYKTAYDRIVASDFTLRTTQASVCASAHEIQVSKQGWIPKLQVGYRRTTEQKEGNNGFLVGASFPLFSNRNKVNIAKKKYVGAQLQLDNTRIQAENRLHSQFNEIQQLRKAIQAYDVELMRHTLNILRKAVEGGELSVIEYYVEADGIYQNLQAYIGLENQLQKVIADLYKNEL